jgi:hypothetical protein
MKTNTLKQVVCCELLATIIFFLCLWLLQIDQLWSEKYIDMVVADWSRNPIEEIEVIDASKDCKNEFSPIGQAYFWTINDGCSCAKSVSTSDLLSVGECSESQWKNGC